MKRNEPDTTVIQEAPQLPKEIIVQIAGYCQPREKNNLMRLCKAFCACLKDRKLILQANLSTVSMKDKQEDIFMYAYANNIEMIRMLVENGVGINQQNILGMTLLDIANSNRNQESIQFLKSLGARCNWLRLPTHSLHEAVYKRDVESVKLFLMTGIDPDFPIGKKTVREFRLMSYDPYPSFRSEKIEIIYTPLYIAAYRGYAEIAELLINAGAHVNLECTEGTCLYRALKRGHQHMVKLLLDKKADPNKKCHGITPLGVAIVKNDFEMVQLLLDKGANDYQGTGDEYVLPKELAKRYEYYDIVGLFDHQEVSNIPSFFCCYFFLMFCVATGICVFGH